MRPCSRRRSRVSVNSASVGGVGAGQRLVQQHQVGLLHQRAGEQHPLALAARELADLAAGEAVHADRRRAPSMARPRSARDGRRSQPGPAVGALQGDVERVQREVPCAAARAAACSSRCRPARSVPTAAGSMPEDRPQQRRLAGAVRADQADDGAARQRPARRRRARAARRGRRTGRRRSRGRAQRPSLARGGRCARHLRASGPRARVEPARTRPQRSHRGAPARARNPRASRWRRSRRRRRGDGGRRGAEDEDRLAAARARRARRSPPRASARRPGRRWSGRGGERAWRAAVCSSRTLNARPIVPAGLEQGGAVLAVSSQLLHPPSVAEDGNLLSKFTEMKTVSLMLPSAVNRILLTCLCVARAAGLRQRRSASAGPGQITVVATTTQMQDLVHNVGGAQRARGRHAASRTSTRTTSSPHRSTVVALAGAKLVVESGVGVDAWAEELVASAGTWTRPTSSPRRACRCGRATPPEPDGDPHWWRDPTLFERAATALAATAGRGRPRRTRADVPGERRALRRRLRRMDAANRRLIAMRAAAERKLVTNHDAFGYFAAHYGMTRGRLGHPLAVHRRPAERPGQVADADRADPGSSTSAAIFTESSIDPAARAQIGLRPASGSTRTCTATRSARAARRARPISGWRDRTSRTW